MSKKMINLENEMPGAGAEMPMGNMNDDSMIPEEDEMPTGNMTDDPAEITNPLTPPQFGEMPEGSMMNDPSENYGSQMPMGVEMPVRSMNGEGATNISSSLTSTGGEMPVGSMNGSTANYAAAQDKLKIIEIPGSWKLQLIHTS